MRLHPINSTIKIADDAQQRGSAQVGMRCNGCCWWSLENNLVKKKKKNDCLVRIVFRFLGASTKDLTQNIKTRAIFKKQSPSLWRLKRNNHLYQKLLVPFYWCQIETSCLLPSLWNCCYCLREAQLILRDPTHSGHLPFKVLPSSRGYRALKARTKRLKQGCHARAKIRHEMLKDCWMGMERSLFLFMIWFILNKNALYILNTFFLMALIVCLVFNNSELVLTSHTLQRRIGRNVGIMTSFFPYMVRDGLFQNPQGNCTS